MHSCLSLYNLFIQTSRLLLLFQASFLDPVKAKVLKIYSYAINFKISF